MVNTCEKPDHLYVSSPRRSFLPSIYAISPSPGVVSSSRLAQSRRYVIARGSCSCDWPRQTGMPPDSVDNHYHGSWPLNWTARHKDYWNSIRDVELECSDSNTENKRYHMRHFLILTFDVGAFLGRRAIWEVKLQATLPCIKFDMRHRDALSRTPLLQDRTSCLLSL